MATAPNPETYAELTVAPKPAIHDKLSKRPGRIGMIGFGIVLVIGVIYSAYHLLGDLSNVHTTSVMPYVLLGIALLVALGFESSTDSTTPPTPSPPSFIPTPSSRTSPSSGPASGTSWRSHLQRPRRLRHRLSPRRTHPASGQRSRLRHGFRITSSRHHLESRHLVVRSPRLQFPHSHRLHHRSRHGQPTHCPRKPAPVASIGAIQVKTAGRAPPA